MGIFNVIGTPTEGEIGELDREDSKKYLRCFNKRQGEGLKPKFPHVEGASIDILEKMLRFSPRARLSVPSALEHPLFADIRDVPRETTAPQLVVPNSRRKGTFPKPYSAITSSRRSKNTTRTSPRIPAPSATA